MSAAGWTRPFYEARYVPVTVVRLDRTPPASTLLSSIVSAGAAARPLSLPSLWPCPSANLLSRLHGSRAWLSWNESGLHALFDVRGPFLAARDSATDKLSIHADSRVELFVCPAGAASDDGAMCYRGFEFNTAGRCLDFTVSIDWTGERQFDYSWKGSAVGAMQDQDDGWKDVDSSDYSRLYRISLPWQDVGLPSAPLPTATSELLVGLYRGEVVDAEAEHAEHVWTSWVDPQSADVSFHTPRTFARVRLIR